MDILQHTWAYNVARYDLISPASDGVGIDPLESASRYEVTAAADLGAARVPEDKPSR